MTKSVRATKEDAGQRLDRWLAARLPELSRTRIQELMAEGRVRVNGAAAKASQRVEPGQRIEVDAVERPAPVVAAEDLPLDVLYEDGDVIVVNKPAGMVVHVGAGEAARHGTLVNALLHRYRSLSKGGSGSGAGMRPGIVHRLDKETSGVIVVARNDAAHRALAEQFESRSVQKTYIALVHGSLKGASGRIELPIARDPKRRTRMTAKGRTGRTARTDWRALMRLGGDAARGRSGFTLVAVELHTGRTHQIRVHFSALGHPVAGDALYGAPAAPRMGKAALPALGRNFLHAARIRFTHPRTGKPMEARAPLPAELRRYLDAVGKACGMDARPIDDAVREFL